MWTLVTLLSMQFRDLTEPLYRETKQMLESLSSGSTDQTGCETELAQTWVLVATFESMRASNREAWMSAGRAFRFIQGMGYHEIDSLSNAKGVHTGLGDGFIETEEKRRVFWMAYFLDHLFSIRNDWPITLNEHVICTRLPSPDIEFQSGQYVLGGFLSEVMTESRLKVQSPFNECLILATICGRSLFRVQNSNISKVYGAVALGRTEQHRWLDSILTTRLHVLSQLPPSSAATYDPLFVFANILGQATIVYLFKGLAQSFAMPGEQLETNVEGCEYHHRLFDAVDTMIRLAKPLVELHASKIHPLMPIPLFLTAEFLYERRSSHPRFLSCLQELVSLFHQLRNVNDHEQCYMDLLPHSCVSKSVEILNHGVNGRVRPRSNK
ncbi:hypothetical protein BBP40_003365 [Aspergillus hancockii]|nr:hypothetical protein BBP40_003365 [Aspergillus hancockii]